MTSAYVSLWRGDICGDKDCQHTYPNDCLKSDEETRIMRRNSCGDDVRPPSAADQHLQSARHTHWVQSNLFTRRHKYMRDTHTGSRTICLHADMNTCETPTHWVQNNLFTCRHEYMQDTHTLGPEQSVYMST